MKTKKIFFISGYYLKSNKYKFILAQNIRAASKSIKHHYQQNNILDNFLLKVQIKLSANKILKPIPKAHASLNIIKDHVGNYKYNKFKKIFVARDTVSWIRSILIQLANSHQEIISSNYEKLDTIDNILKKIKNLTKVLTQTQFIYDLNGNLICDYCIDYSKLKIALDNLGKKLLFSFDGLKNVDKINPQFFNDNKLIIDKMRPSHDTLYLCKEIWTDDFKNFNNFKSDGDGFIINKMKSNTSSILSDNIYQNDPYLFLLNKIKKLLLV
jgi:hypothetical protein